MGNSERDLFDSDEATVDEIAVSEWKSETTAAERVEGILRGTTEFKTAGELADSAYVSEPTARKHLESLVGSGIASSTSAGATTRYRRNPDQRRFERVRQLADEHTQGELEASIREMKSRIRSFEDRYGTTSPEELVVDLDPEDGAGWDDVSRWKTTRRNLAFAKTALSYVETRRIDAMTGGDDHPAPEEYA